MDPQTTPTQTSQAPATTPKPRTPRPAPPPVHAGPLALGIANAGTIAAATLAHVAGPIGLAAAALGAASVGGVAVASRARQRRTVAGSVRRSTSVAGRPARILGGSRRGSLLPKLGSGGGRQAAAVGGRSAAKPGRAPAATGKLGRVAAAVKPATVKPSRPARQAGPRIGEAVRAALTPDTKGRRPTARTAARTARRAIAATSTPVRRSLFRRFLAGASAGLAAGTVAGVRRLSKVGSKNITMSHRPATPPPAKRGRVATTVRRAAATPTQKAPATVPAPAPARTRHRPATSTTRTATRTPATTRTAGAVMSPMQQMLELAEQMVTIATKYEPVGMVEVIEEFEKWPEVQRTIARAVKELHAKAQDKFPVGPVIVDLIQAVNRTQLATATAADQIGPVARAVHRDQLEALEDPRNAMWDHRANQDRK